ncbi:hypothetical protein L1987_27172 [Smallanthus sonchifolius]|uniref:Uncharacterized protein n=1 Tax=Smallanthus sonchifolius TaxID=185202 RepID=A0ACB9IC98_9ASTR|nr:hypothetical protein L1987_27172 [Smallanthus sonchifolius]
MEGSKGFQDSVQANYPYQYQPLSQPMGPNQQFQGQPLSQTMGQNQPFQGEHLSQPTGQKQPFQGQPLSQTMGQNQPFQCQPLSQPIGQEQPFQGHPLSQSMDQNQPFQGEPLSQPLGKSQPFQGKYLSQPMGQNQPFQSQRLSQPRGLNHPFLDEPSSNIFTVQASNNIDESIHVRGNRSHGSCLNWTDETARLLITAISYIAEAESSELREDASSNKLKLIPKMTMWKVISTVMSERGFNVSPQQCEEKFGDINNKYKQMIGLLGRATSCNVVENPILLDSINMPENKKEKARKLFQSEQFLYRDMCSFHHGNRMFLPHDWELRRSVFLNLANNCDEHFKNQQGNHNETGQNQNESEVLRARWAETEEKSLEIQEQRLQFEKERFEWLCFNRNEDLKLEKMRLENESLKLENAKLSFELKHRQKFSDDENH